MASHPPLQATGEDGLRKNYGGQNGPLPFKLPQAVLCRLASVFCLLNTDTYCMNQASI